MADDFSLPPSLGDGVTLLLAKAVWQLQNSSPGGGAAWGSITGTLSNQTDLQNALNSKINSAGGDISFTTGVSGDIDAAIDLALQDYLPLAGGTMGGTVSFADNVIRLDIDGSAIFADGGFGISTTGTILLYGTPQVHGKPGEDDGLGGTPGNALDVFRAKGGNNGSGPTNGGNAGYINISGGNATDDTASGGNAGYIDVSGGDGLSGSGGSGQGGYINVQGVGNGDGGYFEAKGDDQGVGGNTGGHFQANASGGNGDGGSFVANAGASGPGGTVNTSNGGGNIDTTGTGSIGLGTTGNRTTIVGTASSDRSQSLVDDDGFLSLYVDLNRTNSPGILGMWTTDSTSIIYWSPDADSWLQSIGSPYVP